MIVNYDTLIPAIYKKCQEAEASGEDWKFLENKTIWAIFDSELKTAFDATVLDLGGHNSSLYAGFTLHEISLKEDRQSQLLYESIKERTQMALRYLIKDIRKGLIENKSYEQIKADVLKAPVYFYVLDVIIQNSLISYCHVCGNRKSYFMKDGVISSGSKITPDSPYWAGLDSYYHIMLKNEKEGETCPYPHGINEFVQYMDVKSNYLVFDNDMSNIIKIDPMESIDYVTERSGYYNNINSDIGAMYDQELCLSKGLLKVQVGNSSPIVAYNAATGVILASDPIAWKTKKHYKFPFDVSGFRAKGDICTDVWTVQAVDSIVFEDEAKEDGISLKQAAERHGFLVTVKPGKYKVTNYNGNGPVFFAMERVE